jgi:glycosyltransferase involved in cell wall biosynthesis
MKTKEKILILFHGEHIAYSPTVIQLYDELSKKYDVTITAEFPRGFNNQKLQDRNVIYHRYFKVKTRYFYWVLFKIVSLFNKEALYFRINKINYKQYFFRFCFIKKVLKKNAYKRVISVDTMNVLFCSVMKRKTDFLSLELCVDEEYFSLIDIKYLECVLIQSTERYQYLLKNNKVRTFYVQNAPIYKNIPIKKNRVGLIYGGSAYDELGFYHCLNYLAEYSDEKMTVQGAIMKKDFDKVKLNYHYLLEENRLLINKNYLDNDEVVKFLSDFEIGFCFYNFDVPVIRDNYFNYASAPSGKMFKYLAAGVPVVASDIIGFKFVNEFECGVLLENLDPKEIRKAIIKIRKNYSFYVENSIKAAKFYSFDKAISPYLDFIEAND